MTIKTIARLVNGTIDGNKKIQILAPSNIDTAKQGDITFLSNSKYEKYVYSSNASAILVSNSFVPTQAYSATLIRVPNAYSSFAKVLALFEQTFPPQKGVGVNTSIHPTAKIGKNCQIDDLVYINEGAKIGKNCIIYPQVYIGAQVKVGNNSILYPGVKIYHHCQIGKRCIIQSNAVIGSDGFGFAPLPNGTYSKIPQVGTVIIEDDVEIGANTVIDRATTNTTIIKKGSKLDNLVQIAHNVEVGSHCVIAAQVGIAGSAKIGNHCQIGGQAGFVGHVQIADGVKVQAQSGVAGSILEKGSSVFGYPAIGYRDYLKAYTIFKQLPKLEKRIRDLEKQIAENS